MGSSWVNFGVIMGSSWGHFGIILGSSWDHFGVTLGSIWDHFGIILGSFWDHVGIMLGSIWYQFGVMLGSFLAVRTGRSPERGGRQNGQTLARTAPARSAPDRKPDWRSRQVGQNAKTARTPERQIDNSLPAPPVNLIKQSLQRIWSFPPWKHATVEHWWQDLLADRIAGLAVAPHVPQ